MSLREGGDKTLLIHSFERERISLSLIPTERGGTHGHLSDLHAMLVDLAKPFDSTSLALFLLIPGLLLLGDTQRKTESFFLHLLGLLDLDSFVDLCVSGDNLASLHRRPASRLAFSSGRTRQVVGLLVVAEQWR